MIDLFLEYKYLITPFLIWFCIQTFKLIYDMVTTKKFNFKRILGAGGMPSSHSAVVTCMATMIGKSQGLNSPIFALNFLIEPTILPFCIISKCILDNFLTHEPQHKPI